MKEEIETEKWRIFFRKPADKHIDESYIELIFRLKSDHRQINSICEDDLNQLQEDINDLGKWRIFKKLKRELID